MNNSAAHNNWNCIAHPGRRWSTARNWNNLELEIPARMWTPAWRSIRCNASTARIVLRPETATRATSTVTTSSWWPSCSSDSSRGRCSAACTDMTTNCRMATPLCSCKAMRLSGWMCRRFVACYCNIDALVNTTGNNPCRK